GPTAETLARLIQDLDSDRFAVRQKATGELERLGERAAPALLETLKGLPALEVRRRIERILIKIEEGDLPADELRALRAVEVLEHAATREAEPVLRELAGGAEGALLTQEAKAALARRARRGATP